MLDEYLKMIDEQEKEKLAQAELTDLLAQNFDGDALSKIAQGMPPMDASVSPEQLAQQQAAMGGAPPPGAAPGAMPPGGAPAPGAPPMGGGDPMQQAVEAGKQQAGAAIEARVQQLTQQGVAPEVAGLQAGSEASDAVLQQASKAQIASQKASQQAPAAGPQAPGLGGPGPVGGAGGGPAGGVVGPTGPTPKPGGMGKMAQAEEWGREAARRDVQAMLEGGETLVDPEVIKLAAYEDYLAPAAVGGAGVAGGLAGMETGARLSARRGMKARDVAFRQAGKRIVEGQELRNVGRISAGRKMQGKGFAARDKLKGLGDKKDFLRRARFGRAGAAGALGGMALTGAGAYGVHRALKKEAYSAGDAGTDAAIGGTMAGGSALMARGMERTKTMDAAGAHLRRNAAGKKYWDRVVSQSGGSGRWQKAVQRRMGKIRAGKGLLGKPGAIAAGGAAAGLAGYGVIRGGGAAIRKRREQSKYAAMNPWLRRGLIGAGGAAVGAGGVLGGQEIARAGRRKKIEQRLQKSPKSGAFYSANPERRKAVASYMSRLPKSKHRPVGVYNFSAVDRMSDPLQQRLNTAFKRAKLTTRERDMVYGRAKHALRQRRAAQSMQKEAKLPRYLQNAISPLKSGGGYFQSTAGRELSPAALDRVRKHSGGRYIARDIATAKAKGGITGNLKARNLRRRAADPGSTYRKWQTTSASDGTNMRMPGLFRDARLKKTMGKEAMDLATPVGKLLRRVGGRISGAGSKLSPAAPAAKPTPNWKHIGGAAAGGTAVGGGAILGGRRVLRERREAKIERAMTAGHNRGYWSRNPKRREAVATYLSKMPKKRPVGVKSGTQVFPLSDKGQKHFTQRRRQMQKRAGMPKVALPLLGAAYGGLTAKNNKGGEGALRGAAGEVIGGTAGSLGGAAAGAGLGAGAGAGLGALVGPRTVQDGYHSRLGSARFGDPRMVRLTRAQRALGGALGGSYLGGALGTLGLGTAGALYGIHRATRSTRKNKWKTKKERGMKKEALPLLGAAYGGLTAKGNKGGEGALRGAAGEVVGGTAGSLGGLVAGGTLGAGAGAGLGAAFGPRTIQDGYHSTLGSARFGDPRMIRLTRGQRALGGALMGSYLGAGLGTLGLGTAGALYGIHRATRSTRAKKWKTKKELGLKKKAWMAGAAVGGLTAKKGKGGEGALRGAAGDIVGGTAGSLGGGVAGGGLGSALGAGIGALAGRGRGAGRAARLGAAYGGMGGGALGATAGGIGGSTYGILRATRSTRKNKWKTKKERGLKKEALPVIGAAYGGLTAKKNKAGEGALRGAAGEVLGGTAGSLGGATLGGLAGAGLGAGIGALSRGRDRGRMATLGAAYGGMGGGALGATAGGIGGAGYGVHRATRATRQGKYKFKHEKTKKAGIFGAGLGAATAKKKDQRGQAALRGAGGEIAGGVAGGVAGAGIGGSAVRRYMDRQVVKGNPRAREALRNARISGRGFGLTGKQMLRHTSRGVGGLLGGLGLATAGGITGAALATRKTRRGRK